MKTLLLKLVRLVMFTFIYVIAVKAYMAFIYWDIEVASIGSWSVETRIVFILIYILYITIVLYFLQPKWDREGTIPPKKTKYTDKQLIGICLQAASQLRDDVELNISTPYIQVHSVKDLRDVLSTHLRTPAITAPPKSK